MALASGTRLGPFEVLALIGEGGMGEVYRARDTRLDRTVAIKVLPAALAADADPSTGSGSSRASSGDERRARFEREARAVAALNHPHICALHDIGEYTASAGGPPLLYLVMEHLAGETLATRLAKGPLPVAQAVEIAAQIAEALDAAHRHAVVHRDLKPANVMLTKGGAKLLDFGLARLGATHEHGAVLGMSAMMTRAGSPVTQQGTIVGTLPYMAPEQLEGKPADERTDVWAFGTVLYEMLTGTPAFAGESAASLVGAILAKEPAPVAALQPLTPPALDRLVRTCLAKDPDERVQNAHDLVLDLRWASDAIAAPAVTTAPGRPWRRWLGVAAAFLAGLALATAVVVGIVGTREAAPRRVVRFSIEVPASRDLGVIALSPDGRRLAYVGTEGGRAQIFVRAFDQLDDSPVQGTDGAYSPFFSPDGAWIGFFAGDQLRKVPVSGGQAVTVCDADASDSELSATATWADDNTIIFSRGTAALSRVPAAGGSPVAVTTLDPVRHELSHAWPFILPGGAGALYTVARGVAFDQFHVAAVSLETQRARTVLPVGTAPNYLATGHLLYVKGVQLLAVRYDAGRMEPIGTPVVVVDSVGFLARPGTGSIRYAQPQYSVSRAGDLAYASPLPATSAVVVRVDRVGRRSAIVELPSGFRGSVGLAPDGRRLAVYRTDAQGFTVWTVDVDRGILTRVLGEGNPHAPVWSPDGERLAFSQDHEGTSNVFVQAADGAGTAELLVASAQHGDPGSWSRDGRWIVYTEASSDTDWDLWALDVPAHRARPFRRAPRAQQQPTISPDGQWVAYASNETGTFQVYVEAFPSGGKRIQISPEGGTEPLWTSSGRELIYRNQHRLMSVGVSPGATLSVTKPVQVLDASFLAAATYGPPAYAIAPDGRSFYFIEPKAQPPTPRRINIVLGWVDELERRMGGRAQR